MTTESTQATTLKWWQDRLVASQQTVVNLKDELERTQELVRRQTGRCNDLNNQIRDYERERPPNVSQWQIRAQKAEALLQQMMDDVTDIHGPDSRHREIFSAAKAILDAETIDLPPNVTAPLGRIQTLEDRLIAEKELTARQTKLLRKMILDRPRTD